MLLKATIYTFEVCERSPFMFAQEGFGKGPGVDWALIKARIPVPKEVFFSTLLNYGYRLVKLVQLMKLEF